MGQSTGRMCVCFINLTRVCNCYYWFVCNMVCTLTWACVLIFYSPLVGFSSYFCIAGAASALSHTPKPAQG
jgi:hypothetical protein